MPLTHIPTKIVLLVMVTCGLFLATLFGTLDWVRKGMDARAGADSTRLIASQFAGDVEGLAIVTQDYANWELAYDSINNVDLPWIIDNFGVTTVTGVTYDRLALVDGPLQNTYTWGKNGPTAPSAAYVPRAVITDMRALLLQYPITLGQSAAFVAMVNGSPALFSGMYVLPGQGADLQGMHREDLVIAIFGRTLTPERLIYLGEKLILHGLEVTTMPPANRPFFAMPGANGRPAVYLSWAPPKPGTELFMSLLPMLLWISVGFVAVSLTVAVNLRQNAQRLVEQEAAASRAARTEPMTGLPNRAAFIEHIKSLDRIPVFGLAILFLDINGFKRINDTVGHAGGDAVVLELSRRLSTLSDSQRFFARIGGDEFVYVLVDPINVTYLAYQTTIAITALLKADFTAGGQRLVVSAAQGLAIKDKAVLSVAELVRRADIAMYHAKRTSATEAQNYNEEIETISQQDRIIEKALRHGLDNPQEFTIHYQPIVDAVSTRLVRAEALARWRSATIGVVDPDRFIRVAEAAGLIPALGRVLIDRICDDLVTCPDLRVSINISPIQLQAPDFVAELSQALHHKGIAPQRVEVELTEGVIIEDPEFAARQLSLLHERGFTTALDDFGTGFSSIGYLRDLPFGTLKIDRSFVDPETISPRNCELIRSIIHLGHSFGQKVVCEGIETEAQAQQLRAMGCDKFQGYLFSKPLPLDQFILKYPQLVRSIAA